MTATAVREHPLLMCGPLVCQTLKDLKTMTRRVVKPQPIHRAIKADDGLWYDADCTNPGHLLKCPYGEVGSRLWVRETWASDIAGCQNGITYRADHIDPSGDGPANPIKWRPSIFMPRWASRLTLEITDIRVERLQEIQWPDVIREGFKDPRRCEKRIDRETGLVAQFRELWAKLNGAKSPWENNSWVWVISYRRIK